VGSTATRKVITVALTEGGHSFPAKGKSNYSDTGSGGGSI